MIKSLYDIQTFKLSCCKKILSNFVNSKICLFLLCNNSTKDYILYLFKTSLVTKN